jgi:hypothetical protein
MEAITKTTAEKSPKTERNFVRIEVKDDARSLMQCGGGSLCNESK